MNEKTVRYLADFLKSFGMTKNFAAGTINSLDNPLERVVLLECFMEWTEKEVISTKEMIRLAVEAIIHPEVMN